MHRPSEFGSANSHPTSAAQEPQRRSAGTAAALPPPGVAIMHPSSLDSPSWWLTDQPLGRHATF
eukprot:6316019-Prymnesium_polylepis.1